MNKNQFTYIKLSRKIKPVANKCEYSFQKKHIFHQDKLEVQQVNECKYAYVYKLCEKIYIDCHILYKNVLR